jgi:hypothetical protein
MVSAKKDEYCSDRLQSTLFKRLVDFYSSEDYNNMNIASDVRHFIEDCHTYITHDRDLQINTLIECELKKEKEENVTFLSLERQDDYYLKGIVEHRKIIFNTQQ